jgi:hypothetical protein
LPAAQAADDPKGRVMRSCRRHAQRVAVAFSVATMFFLLASQVVTAGQARTPVLRPPVPNPVDRIGSPLFRGYTHAYRFARCPWIRRSWCVILDGRTAA